MGSYGKYNYSIMFATGVYIRNAFGERRASSTQEVVAASGLTPTGTGISTGWVYCQINHEHFYYFQNTRQDMKNQW